MATTVSLKPNAVELSGSTSGTTTLQATAVAGTTTITLPAATDTLVGKATTDTLTNKTLTSPTLTTPNITTGLTLTGAAGTSGQVLTSAGSGSAPTWSTVSADTVGFKNRLINSAMVIDQRNAGASVTQGSGTNFSVDRWATYCTNASKISIQQNAGSVTPPVGFTNYVGITSLAATSLAAGDEYFLRQVIEGYNIADLGWGTANAKTVTLSFQVYSSLTGTFGGSLSNSAQNRCYPFSYTISSANTWTQISVTVAGDTTGTWLTTNGQGLRVMFGLGVGSTYGSGTAGAWTGSTVDVPTGSVSVVGTNAATWYVTGVQLEKGSTATSFDYRPYGTELQLCQRYCARLQAAGAYTVFGVGFEATTTTAYGQLKFPTTMRAKPTLTSSGGFRLGDYANSYAVTMATPDASVTGYDNLEWSVTGTGFTGGRVCEFQANNDANTYIVLSAEL